MATSPSHDTSYKILEPQVVYQNEHHNTGYSYGLCREAYYPSYPPMTSFGRMATAWDYGLYARDPYYQTLFSLHAARGFGAAAFLPRSFKSFYGDEEKPNQSYIGLIGQAIMSSPEKKLVLSDIYKWVLQHYAYFRNKGPGWKNSVRHNLSLNDCFVKAGRSPNGKGNYWAINPENYDDFRKGDFRRRRAQRRARRCSNIKGQNLENENLTSHEELTCSTLEDEPKADVPAVSTIAKNEGKVRTFDVENLLRDDQQG